MRITQAPRWKLLIRTELERFFELPIMQAPKRNSKWRKEMWTASVFPKRFWAPRRVRAVRDGAVTSARASILGRVSARAECQCRLGGPRRLGITQGRSCGLVRCGRSMHEISEIDQQSHDGEEQGDGRALERAHERLDLRGRHRRNADENDKERSERPTAQSDDNAMTMDLAFSMIFACIG